MSTLPFPRSELTIENYRENGISFLTGVLTENDVKALNAEATQLWRTQEHLVPQNLRVGLRTDEND